MDTLPLPVTGTRAFQAGRWVAQAHHLLRFHANQEVSLGLNNGIPHADVKPHWGMGPSMTAHAQLTHAGVLQPQVAFDLFDGVQGSAKVYLHKTGFDGAPAFHARANLDIGSASFHNAGTEDWVDVAQMFGLFCEAVAGQSSFHQTLLWTVIGVGNSNRSSAGLAKWAAKAIRSTGQPPQPSATLHKLKLPFIGDKEEQAALSLWMGTALKVSAEQARTAFVETEDVLSHTLKKPNTNVEPKADPQVGDALAFC